MFCCWTLKQATGFVVCNKWKRGIVHQNLNFLFHNAGSFHPNLRVKAKDFRQFVSRIVLLSASSAVPRTGSFEKLYPEIVVQEKLRRNSQALFREKYVLFLQRLIVEMTFPSARSIVTLSTSPLSNFFKQPNNFLKEFRQATFLKCSKNDS